MSLFPGSIASFLGFTSSHTLSADQHAAQHNSEQAEIVATQTKIGTGASTPASGTVLRSTGAGASAWGQVALSSEVSGVLPQANGGTGTTLATGTGKAVYDTSPTISSPAVSGGVFSSPTLTTPTIASFFNANHTHANAVGGGQLDFNALLSTIFSGQVATTTNAGSAGGTMFYINLGGIKLLWGKTGTLSVSGAAPGSAAFAITFPASFFSTIQANLGTISETANNTTSLYWGPDTSTPSSTGWTFTILESAGSNGSAKGSFFVVGT